MYESMRRSAGGTMLKTDVRLLLLNEPEVAAEVLAQPHDEIIQQHIQRELDAAGTAWRTHSNHAPIMSQTVELISNPSDARLERNGE